MQSVQRNVQGMRAMMTCELGWGGGKPGPTMGGDAAQRQGMLEKRTDATLNRTRTER